MPAAFFLLFQMAAHPGCQASRTKGGTGINIPARGKGKFAQFSDLDFSLVVFLRIRA